MELMAPVAAKDRSVGIGLDGFSLRRTTRLCVFFGAVQGSMHNMAMQIRMTA